MKIECRRSLRGFGLVEIMISIVLMSVIVISLSSVLRLVSTTSVKAREQTYAANFSESFFTRLNNIPYQYIFEVDSSSANYGLTGTFGPVTNQSATYPYLGILDDLRSLMTNYRFDRFTVSVRFMIRDLSDSNGDGRTTDLRPYTDANGDGYDDLDGAVSTNSLRYQDQNGDGDYRDTFISNGDEITEEPHTRLKEVTLRLYKDGQEVYRQVQLVSWEKFTGAEGKAAGATLQIVITTPSENSSVYDLGSSAQQNSFNLVLANPYPSDISATRADGSSPMRIVGQTTPNASLSWKLETTTNPTLDGCTADTLGNFDCPAINVTAGLQEGLNTLYGQATKSVYYSPWNSVTFIRDINPPSVSSQTPASGTIYNRQPFIRAQLADNPVTPGRAVSGINLSTIRLSSGTQSANFQYDPATGFVTWIDPATLLPPVLATGPYTIVLEAGDNAFYKVRSTWTFSLDVAESGQENVDHSAPSVSNKDPIGTAFSNTPTISCRVFDNQSGIILNSVAMTLDGTVVVSSTTGNLLSSIAPLTQQDGVTVSYTPTGPLSSGSHSVTITASHWATDPNWAITTTDNWNFNVP